LPPPSQGLYPTREAMGESCPSATPVRSAGCKCCCCTFHPLLMPGRPTAPHSHMSLGPCRGHVTGSFVCLEREEDDNVTGSVCLSTCLACRLSQARHLLRTSLPMMVESMFDRCLTRRHGQACHLVHTFPPMMLESMSYSQNLLS
jgi:hypothetical protein